MNKKTKLIIITGALVAIVSIVIFSTALPRNRNLVDDPGVSREYRLRIVKVEDAAIGFNAVVNEYDGYKIITPSDWLVSETASLQGGLNVYSDPDGLDIESFSGVLLNILTLNNLEEVREFIPEGTEFSEAKIDGEVAYKTSYSEFESYIDEELNPVYTPIDNSGTIAYIFVGSGNNYFIRCTVTGDENYIELLSQCEEQVLTFEAIK